MRLTRKLLFALIAAVVLVTTLATFFRVNQLREALLAHTLEDDLLLARELALMTSDAWRVDGEREARRLVGHVNQARGGRELGLAVVADAHLDGEPPPHTASLREGEHARIRDHQLMVVAPLDVSDDEPHWLRITRSLDSVDAIVKHNAWISVGTAVATILASALMMTLLGWYFVGEPIQRLIAATRRIARGEVLERRPQQHDEVGELGSALGTMSEELAQAREQVIEAFDAKVAALEQLRHADRLRTAGQLASGLAHEIGTPLNVVSGRARLIERSDGVSDETQADARVIVDQAERIAKLVRQLLDFTRRSEPRRDRVDVTALLSHVRELLSTMAAKQQVSIELISPGPVIIEGDPVLLEQALTNVAVNGIHAMRDGGMLTLRIEEREADDEGRPARSVVSIIDDGPGVPTESRERIFDPFYTTKDVGQGTGLGLSVVSGILADHHGSIRVIDDLSRGAHFEIELPRQTPRDSRPPTAKARRKKKKP